MSTALVWLRNDLRLSDNPALAAACADGGAVAALYIHETDAEVRQPGGAARWWLHHSLEQLGAALAGLGIPLRVETGAAGEVIGRVVAEANATHVHWNRRYGHGERAIDAAIKTELRARGLVVQSHEGNVLAEPWTVQTGQKQPYSVFSPFWKNLREMAIARPVPAPERVGKAVRPRAFDGGYVAPDWSGKLGAYWEIGEVGAQASLAKFLDERLDGYTNGRDAPGKTSTSFLSPHLRFGEISARQVWHAAKALAHAEPGLAGEVDKFLSELAWRDFSYHQLYHRENIAQVPMQAKFAGLVWRSAPKDLRAWQRGQTGFPIVDAGMRELWETGVMQNRVRMLTASLLAKSLLIDWRLGEEWFWDCLVDADVASNPANWQWVAGCGLDAAPYFRIFNPVLQGERFDGHGDYVRRWVPELAGMPDKWLHQPFASPEAVLNKAGVVLGKTYPKPIVDLKAGRQRALDALAELG